MNELDLFKKAVLNSYWDLRHLGTLPTLLNSASRASLRDYTKIRLQDNLLPDDIRILEEFFNPVQKYETLEKAIDKIDTEKLRPLQSFIHRETENPKEITYKLLAILIDFQPRPFKKQDWENPTEPMPPIVGPPIPPPAPVNPSGDVEGEKDKIGKPENSQEDNVTATIPPDVVKNGALPTTRSAPKKRPYTMVQLSYGIVAIAVGAALFMTINSWGAKQCMYWDNDGYVATRCEDAPTGTTTIALDDDLLLKFRKITRPDTLLPRHEKQVWYSKINHEVEFFTSPGTGKHPRHLDRSLKAATKEILKKYAGTSTQKISEN